MAREDSDRRYYAKNRDRVIARAKAHPTWQMRPARNRAYLRKAKAKPCHDCKQRFHRDVMDFDHRPGTTKHRNISQLIWRTLTALKREIAKCDLVCANCHRLRTRRRRFESDPLL